MSALLAGAAIGAIAVGLTGVFVLGVALALYNGLSPTDAAIASALLGALYLPLAVLGATPAVALLLREPRQLMSRRSGAIAGASGALAAFISLNLLFRWPPAYRVLSPADALLVPAGALELAALFAAYLAFCAAAAWFPGNRRRALLACLLAIAILAGAEAGNQLYASPTLIDLEARLSSEVGPPTACQPRTGPAPGLVFLALDGMSWNVAVPLLSDDKMPNLRRLLANAAFGELDPGLPSYSPVVWATIATGLPESAHDVHGFLRMRLPGVSRPISHAPRLSSFTWWGGLNRFLALTADWGLVRTEPVPSNHRRGAALWDIASAHGHRVGVYDWMTTWPVEPVNGYMYNHGRLPSNAHPHHEIVRTLAGVERKAEVHPRIAEYAQHYAKAFALWRHFRPSVSLHFNKVIDNLHDTWSDGQFFALPFRPSEEVPATIEAAYRESDYWIGRFHDALPPDFIFAVVSDHGYEFNGTGHVSAPPGVIVLAGGPFACGRIIRGAHILDVAPSLLAALGLQGTKSMPGSVLQQAVASGIRIHLQRVAEYPTSWRNKTFSTETSDDWQELRDKLEALGYAN